jgi:hypothetical protein
VTSDKEDFKLYLIACHLLARCFAELFYDPEDGGVRSSETSGTTQRTTRRRIPEENTRQNHRCENLKSYITSLVFYSLGFNYMGGVLTNRGS